MKRAFRGLVVLAALCVFGAAAAVHAGGEMSPEEAATLIRDFEAGAPDEDLNRVLTAYSRTLKRLSPVYNEAEFNALWSRLLDYRDDPRFGKDERYHLGWILARHEPDTGYPYLMAVAAEHRDSPEAPKIVFTVGNRLREAGDWDGAIIAYETYIETFPEQTFFVNKAYQHVIDAHLAKGETELAADMQRDVADLINDTGDAVAQMNLARQFDRQGADALARSTWALGRDRAMRQFEAASGQKKDRLAIEIARYAYHFRDKETAEYIWGYAQTRREGAEVSVLAEVAKYLMGNLDEEDWDPVYADFKGILESMRTPDGPNETDWDYARRWSKLKQIQGEMLVQMGLYEEARKSFFAILDQAPYYNADGIHGAELWLRVTGRILKNK